MTNGQVDTPTRPDPTQTLTHLWIAGLVILVIVALALWASQGRGIVAAIGIGVLILFAAAAVGAVLGFLFAIPRLATEQKDAGAMTESKARGYLQSNTNLDKVNARAAPWLSIPGTRPSCGRLPTRPESTTTWRISAWIRSLPRSPESRRHNRREDRRNPYPVPDGFQLETTPAAHARGFCHLDGGVSED